MALHYLIFLIIPVTTSNVTDAQVKGYQSRDRHDAELSVSYLVQKAEEWSVLVGFADWSPDESSYRYSRNKNQISIATESGFAIELDSTNGDLIIITNNRRITQRHSWRGAERGRKFSTAEAENNYALSMVHTLEPASTSWMPRFGRKLDGWRQSDAADNCGYFSIMIRDGKGHGISITFDSKDGQVLSLAWLHGKTKK